MSLVLVSDEVKAKRLTAQPNFKKFQIINSDIVAVRSTKREIVMNKPLWVGFTVLELAKTVLYSFYYDVLVARYHLGIRLLFTDTDSVCFAAKTNDLYADMEEDRSHYDTSNYRTDHPLYSATNAKVLGKMKDELAGN